jgi:hypothetical protein
VLLHFAFGGEEFTPVTLTFQKDFFRFLIETPVSERITLMSTTFCSEATVGRKAVPLRTGQRFPEDLRVWLNGSALKRMAQSIGQEHPPSTVRPVFSLSAARFHHPWRMLALLTYAYASGIWHSRAIAEIAALDPYLFELCHRQPPSAEIIRRFHHHNRIPILRCLEELLRRLWCQRDESGLSVSRALLTAEIFCDARWRLQRVEQSDDDTCAPVIDGR